MRVANVPASVNAETRPRSKKRGPLDCDLAELPTTSGMTGITQGEKVVRVPARIAVKKLSMKAP